MDGGLRETGQPRKVNWESLVGDEEGGASGLRSGSSFRLTTSASAVAVVDDDEDDDEDDLIEDGPTMALVGGEAFLRVEGCRGGDAEGSSLGGRASAGGGLGFLSVLGGKGTVVDDAEEGADIASSVGWFFFSRMVGERRGVDGGETGKWGKEAKQEQMAPLPPS